MKRGSLAVAASNGRDSIVMCLERPTAASFDASSWASPSTSTTSPSTTTHEADRRDDGAGTGEHDGKDGRRKRRRYVGAVRDPGLGVGIVDSANNQDRKLCEVKFFMRTLFQSLNLCYDHHKLLPARITRRIQQNSNAACHSSIRTVLVLNTTTTTLAALWTCLAFNVYRPSRHFLLPKACIC